MTWRIAYLLACILVLAGITHISVVLLIPAVGTKDAFAELSRQIELLEFTPLDAGQARATLTDVDPFFAYGVCRFDLSQTGMALSGPRIDTFWSATVLDGDGTVIYSLNRRTAVDQKPELILLDPVQILRIRELQPPEVENAIVIESDISDGFVVLRVLRPDPTWELKAGEFLDAITCNGYVPELAPETTPEEQPAS